jgi:hypothetical protein
MSRIIPCYNFKKPKDTILKANKKIKIRILQKIRSLKMLNLIFVVLQDFRKKVHTVQNTFKTSKNITI